MLLQTYLITAQHPPHFSLVFKAFSATWQNMPFHRSAAVFCNLYVTSSALMPNKLLSDAHIRTLGPKAKQYEVFDTKVSGFAIRVSLELRRASLIVVESTICRPRNYGRRPEDTRVEALLELQPRSRSFKNIKYTSHKP